MEQVPPCSPQALDVLTHRLMLCLGIFLLLEAELVIETICDCPAQLLCHLLPTLLNLTELDMV